MKAMDFVLFEQFASDPNAVGKDLVATEADMWMRLSAHGVTHKVVGWTNAILAAIHRNPALPLVRLRQLVSAGVPEALENPRAHLAGPKCWRTPSAQGDSVPTALDIAANPQTPTAVLSAMEGQANAMLRDTSLLKSASLSPGKWRSVLRRNPNFSTDRLRLLLAIGDPDAWANPSADFLLVDRPMGQGEMKYALVLLGLRLAGLDVVWVAPTIKRLRAYESRLVDHPEWRRWGAVLADLSNGTPKAVTP